MSTTRVRKLFNTLGKIRYFLVLLDGSFPIGVHNSILLIWIKDRISSLWEIFKLPYLVHSDIPIYGLRTQKMKLATWNIQFCDKVIWLDYGCSLVI